MHPPFLHKVIQSLLNHATFQVDFGQVTDNHDGTLTLLDVCHFHHLQPGKDVTIGGHTYTIQDYDEDQKTITVIGTDAITVTSFTLPVPAFYHGTPLAQSVELTKITPSVKDPMIYLMEPYKTHYNNSPSSNIDCTFDFTLCFLANAEVLKLPTANLYHNAIFPMKFLMEDFLNILDECQLFMTEKQQADPVWYTQFGINIKSSGTSKLYFAEKLSGVAVDLHLEMYRLEDCADCESNRFLQEDLGNFIEVD